jgi:hypothetical protein
MLRRMVAAFARMPIAIKLNEFVNCAPTYLARASVEIVAVISQATTAPTLTFVPIVQMKNT